MYSWPSGLIDSMTLHLISYLGFCKAHWMQNQPLVLCLTSDQIKNQQGSASKLKYFSTLPVSIWWPGQSVKLSQSLTALRLQQPPLVLIARLWNKKTDHIFLLSYEEHHTHIRHPPPLPSQFLCPADVAGADPEAGDCEVFPSPELLCLPVSKPNAEIV